MANLRLAAATRNALLQKVADAINGGAGAGTIKIYTGTQPANADTGLSGNTLLGTLTFSDPCEDNVTAGVLTFDPVTSDAAADATGTATWARIADSTGTTVFDCDVGTSGATIVLNTVSIVSGSPIDCTSATLTYPAT